MEIPHPDSKIKSVNCALITVSDPRTFDTDISGKIAQEILIKNNHKISHYEIVKDDPHQIKFLLENLASIDNLECLILSGGTGISSRDNTYDIISQMLDKT